MQAGYEYDDDPGQARCYGLRRLSRLTWRPPAGAPGTTAPAPSPSQSLAPPTTPPAAPPPSPTPSPVRSTSSPSHGGG